MAEQSELEVTTEETESETVEVEEQETEEQKPEETEGEAKAEPEEPEEPEELQVTIGEESPASEEAKEAPNWVKELRRRNREQERELRELRARIGSTVETVPQLPPRPTLPDCDYDEDLYTKRTDAWYAKKLEIDEFVRRKAEEKRKADEEAQQRVNDYERRAKELKVKDFNEAQDEAASALSRDQMALILIGADRPELLIYALGKRPEKLHELASIKDPAKFAVAIGKLEEKLKVTSTKSKAAPKPEPTVRSSSGVQSSEATLNRLREEAMRTGDMTKVIEFKRQMRAKST